MGSPWMGVMLLQAKNTRSRQKMEEARKDSSLEILEEDGPADTLISIF